MEIHLAFSENMPNMNMMWVTDDGTGKEHFVEWGTSPEDYTARTDSTEFSDKEKY